jgi:hypothetical protein
VYVYIDEDHIETEQNVQVASSTLISELEAHIEDLREQLNQANERDRGNAALLPGTHPALDRGNTEIC